MIKLSWLARATDAEVFEEHVNFAVDAGLDVIDFHLRGCAEISWGLHRL